MRAGLSVGTSGTTVDRQCSSGLQAIAIASGRVVLDGVPIATYAAGEVQFLEKLAPKDEWEARNAVLRRHVPAALVPLDEA